MYYVQVQFTYTFYWSFKREKNILKEGKKRIIYIYMIWCVEWNYMVVGGVMTCNRRLVNEKTHQHRIHCNRKFNITKCMNEWMDEQHRIYVYKCVRKNRNRKHIHNEYVSFFLLFGFFITTTYVYLYFIENWRIRKRTMIADAIWWQWQVVV